MFKKIYTAILIIILFPSISWAKDLRASIIINGINPYSKRAEELITHYIYKLFEDQNTLKLIPLKKILGRVVYQEVKEELGSIEYKMDKSKEAYEYLDLDTAVKILNQVINLYEQNVAYTKDMKKIADVLMLLGAVHILRGEEKAGINRLLQAITLNPIIKPDPFIFNEGMQKIFQHTMKRAKKRSEGSIFLNSIQSYTRVYINNQFIGLTPIKTPKLLEGRYYIRLEKKGYYNWGRMVDVREGEKVSLLSDLEEIEDMNNFMKLNNDVLSEFIENPKHESTSAIKKLNKILNIDILIFMTIDLSKDVSKIEARGYDFRNLDKIIYATKEFNYASLEMNKGREIKTFILENFTAFKNEEGVELEDTVEESILSIGRGICYGMFCDNFKKTVIYSNYILALTLSGLGVYSWVRAKNINNEYKSLAQAHSDRPSTRLRGKNSALTGDLLITSASIATITSVLLTLFWEPTPSTKAIMEKLSHRSILLHPLKNGAIINTQFNF